MSVDQGKKLMVVCRNYVIATEKMIEKQTGKLLSIAQSIKALDKDGHAQFRAEIEVERQNIIAARTAGALDSTDWQGYMSSSYTVLLANWKAISKACELGLDILRTDGKPKAWSLLYKDAVKLNQDAQQKAAQEKQATVNAARPELGKVVIGAPTSAPTVQKVSAGRPSTSLFDLALKACENLKANNPKEFMRLGTYIAREMNAMVAENATKAHAETGKATT